MTQRNILLVLAAIAVVLAMACNRKEQRAAVPVGPAVEIVAPLGLPVVPIPADNPPTVETVALGRRLYYEPMLSLDNTVSCATCHGQGAGFADEHQFSTGVNGKKGGRNSPTVANAAYYTEQFWDGRAPSLEKQAEGPVQNPVEMAHTLQGVETKLMGDPSYRAEFARAFGPGPITYEKVEKAIASFERTVLVANSPFDRYYYGGDKSALTEQARLGLEVFSGKGNCTACHVVGKSYALFTDNKYHNIGVGANGDRLSDLGRYEVTKNEADRGAFRTPSLRNVALTAPYMHDGSLKTLKDVIDYYVGGGNSNPHLDREMKSLESLTRQERDALVAFLESLTGEFPPDVGPPEPARTLTER